MIEKRTHRSSFTEFTPRNTGQFSFLLHTPLMAGWVILRVLHNRKWNSEHLRKKKKNQPVIRQQSSRSEMLNFIIMIIIVGIVQRVLFRHFTLQIHAKVPGLLGDLAILAWTDLAVAAWAAIQATAWAAIRAAALRNAFKIKGHEAVSTRLCESNADAASWKLSRATWNCLVGLEFDTWSRWMLADDQPLHILKKSELRAHPKMWLLSNNDSTNSTACQDKYKAHGSESLQKGTWATFHSTKSATDEETKGP